MNHYIQSHVTCYFKEVSTLEIVGEFDTGVIPSIPPPQIIGFSFDLNILSMWFWLIGQGSVHYECIIKCEIISCSSFTYKGTTLANHN